MCRIQSSAQPYLSQAAHVLCVHVWLLPTTAKVSARLIGLRRSLMKFTDKRVGLMNEIINSMQFLKFYAWERPFQVMMLKCCSYTAPCRQGDRDSAAPRGPRSALSRQ